MDCPNRSEERGNDAGRSRARAAADEGPIIETRLSEDQQ